MNACPLCRSPESRLLHDAADQPAMLNALFSSKAAAMSSPRVKLEFRVCLDCGFVSNRQFSPTQASYDATYVNDQSCSRVYCDHLNRVLEQIGEQTPDGCDSILEVGCGQGGFLRELAQRIGGRALGIDPACTARNDDERITIMPQLFDDNLAHQLAAEARNFDFVCCRHVLEHLADPRAVLRLIRRVLRPVRGVLYVEVPDVCWILEHEAFFDFFHEHCSLFSKASLRCALRAEGFDVTSIEHTFGGQYLSAFARARSAGGQPFEADHELGSRADEHSLALRAARASMQDRIRELGRRGPVFLWGAGAKSVSLLAHLGPGHDVVRCIVDINPAKWHRFVAVSGQEIIPPAELPMRLGARDAPATIVVMNPNYADEIAAQLETLEIDARCFLLDRRPRRVVHA